MRKDRYESLKAAKLSEIKAGEDQRDTKTQELADTDEKNAQVQHPFDSMNRIGRCTSCSRRSGEVGSTP